MNTLHTVLNVVVLAVQKGPEPEDVKAGWLGFGVWLGLAVAVVLLAFSFVKQLKKIDFEEKDPDAAPGDSAVTGTDDSAAPGDAADHDEKQNGSATPS